VVWVICRDRSGSYAGGARIGAPESDPDGEPAAAQPPDEPEPESDTPSDGTMVVMDENTQNEEVWERQAAAQVDWWMKRTAGQVEEALRQNNLMYSGLIGVGVVLVQPFLTSGIASLDLSAKICVIAFSLAIPLLSALLMLNRQETYRRRATKSVLARVARASSLGLGFTGVVAGFWHIMTIAGVAVLIGGILGLAVHSAGFVRVEEEDAQATGDTDQSLKP
jgi:hypothetical protein